MRDITKEIPIHQRRNTPETRSGREPKSDIVKGLVLVFGVTATAIFLMNEYGEMSIAGAHSQALENIAALTAQAEPEAVEAQPTPEAEKRFLEIKKAVDGDTFWGFLNEVLGKPPEALGKGENFQLLVVGEGIKTLIADKTAYDIVFNKIPGLGPDLDPGDQVTIGWPASEMSKYLKIMGYDDLDLEVYSHNHVDLGGGITREELRAAGGDFGEEGATFLLDSNGPGIWQVDLGDGLLAPADTIVDAMNGQALTFTAAAQQYRASRPAGN